MANKKERAINKEIKQLKECVKDKDKRLKEQADRIETIETRYSKIVWCFIISFVVAGFILLGYTMTHIYSKLPDAVTKASSGISRFELLDPLQFVGFYLICFLAFVGFIALLFLVHMILKDWY